MSRRGRQSGRTGNVGKEGIGPVPQRGPLGLTRHLTEKRVGQIRSFTVPVRSGLRLRNLRPTQESIDQAVANEQMTPEEGVLFLLGELADALARRPRGRSRG